MQIYLVGGAVRDRLLQRPVHERDWVVVGSDADAMQAAGYKAVGKDFPVFLHPKTGEEYALARTERKTGLGYKGFSVHAAPDVTLEDDLLRRDLTINAIAEDPDGQLIDPYGGQSDLAARLFRHVSPAFAEDPVRILRVARFAARYHGYGFRLAPETLALMQQMVSAGEVDALVPERIWQELQRALTEPHPEQFFLLLKDCGALKVIMPEIDCLWGIPNPEKYHPEIDTGVHIMMVLQQACLLSDDPVMRFAALTHDLGKGVTPPEHWPSHRGHEELGVAVIEQLCQRLRVPSDYKQLAILCSRYHTHIHRARHQTGSTLSKVLQSCDAYRRPQRFQQLLLACEADFRGRTGWEDKPYPQREFWQQAYTQANQVDVKQLVAAGYQGPAISEQLQQRRSQQLEQLRQQHAQQQ